MHRTTIMLPAALKARALKQAREAGLSLGELVRRSLATSLSRSARERGAGDPFLDDHAVYKGRAPRDLAAEHDRYLYEDARDLR
jgi:hypothetical protein